MSLFDNPLANMYGPLFLLVYFLVALLAFLFVRFRLADRITRRSEVGPPAVIPDQPDPYELAYLRGGTRNVMALVLYTPVRRRWLAVTHIKGSKVDFGIKRRELAPQEGPLTGMEMIVYDAIPAAGVTVADVLKDKTLFQRFNDAIADTIPKQVEQQQLILTKMDQQRIQRTKLWILASVELLAVYKSYAAHLHGHSNVAFLFLLALLVGVVIYQVQLPFGISTKGENYLDHHKRIFPVPLNKEFLKASLYPQQLLIALYGFTVLSFTIYQHFGNYIHGLVTGQILLGYGGDDS